jgi:ATP-dependent Lhr-like helicase
LVETLGVLQGAALVASTLETQVLPLRVTGYRPTDLDELCTSGEVIWVGSGAIGSGDGRVRLYFADQLPLLAAGIEPVEAPAGALHDHIRELLGSRGAVFWGQIREADPAATDTELLAALWDLVWAGEVTNDSLAPLRAVIGGARAKPGSAGAARSRGRPRPGRLQRIGPPAGAGRWSLVAPLLEPRPTSTVAAHAVATQLLERHGVLTREAALAEGVVGGFSAVYGVLKVLEERGQTRRGYFVSGLGAAQFSLPGAVDRLRSVREVPDHDDSPPLVLAATDPAQPYGSTLAWPDSPGRPARSAGALVVLHQGQPLVWFDPRSHHLVTFPATSDASVAGTTTWAAALADLVGSGRLRSAEVRKVDGSPIDHTGAVVAALRAAGFADGYRGLTLRR